MIDIRGGGGIFRSVAAKHRIVASAAEADIQAMAAKDLVISNPVNYTHKPYKYWNYLNGFDINFDISLDA